MEKSDLHLLQQRIQILERIIHGTDGHMRKCLSCFQTWWCELPAEFPRCCPQCGNEDTEDMNITPLVNTTNTKTE